MIIEIQVPHLNFAVSLSLSLQLCTDIPEELSNINILSKVQVQAQNSPYQTTVKSEDFRDIHTTCPRKQVRLVLAVVVVDDRNMIIGVKKRFTVELVMKCCCSIKISSNGGGFKL